MTARSVKEKTVSGMIWSLADQFAHQGITFVTGIILARLLSPQEFGLVGMTAIFIALSQVFIHSGFSHALIRKKDCTNDDYSTVFYFNLAVSLLFYLILFFSAGAIGRFFDEPKLKLIIQVLGAGLFMNALAMVQQTRIMKNIQFKLLTKINVTAAIVSGIIAIILALRGYGVWSLIIKTLAGHLIICSMLWILSDWKPSKRFNKRAFKGLFSFGSKLLLVDVMETIYQNIYLLIIGKYFSSADLGYYTRAEKFKNLPSLKITRVIQKVSFPVLASIQDDVPRMKTAYRKLIKATGFITFTGMIVLAATAEPLIRVLLGEQWLPAVIYLQLLCFVGMLYPLQVINLNMLKVQGRSSVFLRIEIGKKLLAVPVILTGIFFGIQNMILAMIGHAIIAYFIDSAFSGKNIGYPSRMQLVDVLPSILVAAATGFIVYSIPFIFTLHYAIVLILQLFMAGIMSVGLSETFRVDAYLLIKQTVKEKLSSKRKQDSLT